VNVISIKWVHCFWYNIRCWIFGGNFTSLQSNKKMLWTINFVISRFSFKVTPFSLVGSQNREGCLNCYGWTPLLLSHLIIDNIQFLLHLVMDNQSFCYMKLLKQKSLLQNHDFYVILCITNFNHNFNHNGHQRKMISIKMN
jgi:hypothetical protein